MKVAPKIPLSEIHLPEIKECVMDPLRFIKVAWVLESIAVVLASIVFAPFPVVYPQWLAALPYLGTIIAAQGVAAGVGPAVKRAQNGGSSPDGQ